MLRFCHWIDDSMTHTQEQEWPFLITTAPFDIYQMPNSASRFLVKCAFAINATSRNLTFGRILTPPIHLGTRRINIRRARRNNLNRQINSGLPVQNGLKRMARNCTYWRTTCHVLEKNYQNLGFQYNADHWAKRRLLPNPAFPLRLRVRGPAEYGSAVLAGSCLFVTVCCIILAFF